MQHDLSGTDIALIRAGVARADLNLAALVASFYERLFRARPDLRSMFGDDLSAQQAKLADTLRTLVQMIDAPEASVGARLDELGARHRALGVQDEHYPLVVETLLASLRGCCGAHWSTEEDAAWTKLLRAATARMTSRRAVR